MTTTRKENRGTSPFPRGSSSSCWRSLVLAAGAVAGCGRDDEEDEPAAAAATEDDQRDASGRGALGHDRRSTARAPSARSRPRPPRRFRGEQPDVNVEVGISGTGGGFERFCAGETDISDASRPIDEDDEAPLCTDAGISTRVPGRRRRPHRRRQQRERLGHLPDHGPAQEDLGAEGREARSRTGTRSTRASPTRR